MDMSWKIHILLPALNLYYRNLIFTSLSDFPILFSVLLYTLSEATREYTRGVSFFFVYLSISL